MRQFDPGGVMKTAGYVVHSSPKNGDCCPFVDVDELSTGIVGVVLFTQLAHVTTFRFAVNAACNMLPAVEHMS